VSEAARRSILRSPDAFVQWQGQRRARKTMIIALARKLLIALWRYVTTGELPRGVCSKAA
jgi:hypothetical protein